jgi:hypothetical protein
MHGKASKAFGVEFWEKFHEFFLASWFPDKRVLFPICVNRGRGHLWINLWVCRAARHRHRPVLQSFNILKEDFTKLLRKKS